MKQLFCLLTALTVIGCHRDFSVDTPLPGGIDREASGLEKSLSQSDNQFGFKLFHQLNTEAADSNCFISPFSVSMALGMTLNGAAGETEQAMRQTLELTGLTQDEINETYQSLMELLPCQDTRVLFQIANSIWYRENYPVQNTFIDVNQTFFNAVIREMDFSRPDAIDIINAWISENTYGKIKDALDFIPPNIVMYLINAIYFKGAWLFEFDPEYTHAADFTTPYGLRTCQMMSHPEATLMYFRTDDFQAVDLPYGNGKFSMSVFLPAAGLSVDDFIAQFTDARWKQWIARFDSTTIELGLPKFKVEYGKLLNDALTTMGMGVAFTSAADFSRINPGGGLYISRVIHKTFVEVNEEGTEAAAVTIVEMLETASPATTRMIVDRPFVFVIWDHTTSAILFIGKIVEPTLG
jgi:serine protease inhibitor